ncbi:MAG: hypothetical protein J6S21_07045, partial [Victivallales bacterium]|nr:hypothetical protein [Victivallales bacterium]
EMHFALTPVSFRKDELLQRLEKSRKLYSGELPIEVQETGEEGIHQIRALLGLEDLVTNVNLPNMGQIPNLPIGAVVETNAVFRAGTVTPVMAGEIPAEILPMVGRVCAEQEALNKAIAARDVDAIFQQFVGDPLVTCSYADAKKLFKEMCENTKEYLKSYDLSSL